MIPTVKAWKLEKMSEFTCYTNIHCTVYIQQLYLQQKFIRTSYHDSRDRLSQSAYREKGYYVAHVL